MAIRWRTGHIFEGNVFTNGGLTSTWGSSNPPKPMGFCEIRIFIASTSVGFFHYKQHLEPKDPDSLVVPLCQGSFQTMAIEKSSSCIGLVTDPEVKTHQW